MNNPSPPTEEGARQKEERPDRDPEEQDDFMPFAQYHTEETGWGVILRVRISSSLRARLPFSSDPG